MNTVIWVVAGAFLGWLAYASLGFNAAIGMMGSIIIGAMGAVVGGKLIAPLFSANAALADFSPAGLFFALATAAALLAIGNLIQKRWVS